MTCLVCLVCLRPSNGARSCSPLCAREQVRRDNAAGRILRQHATAARRAERDAAIEAGRILPRVADALAELRASNAQRLAEGREARDTSNPETTR